MIWLTGDTHGSFKRIRDFCMEKHTTPEDILIILGDAGVNFSGGLRDIYKKELLASLPVTLLCIHGNHEQRPRNLPCYSLQPWRGGQVYVEEAFPNILFAKDGEVYDLDGKQAVAIGGAYSVDKLRRLMRGDPWFPDEQPTPTIREEVEAKLELLDRKVDLVLTHTCPLKYEPVDTFLSGIDQSTVDKSTEIWLDSIDDRLDYSHWYCGHYHIARENDKLSFLFENYERLS